MSNGMNKVFLLGNLGADPELKRFPDGDAYLRMRLATNEPYRDGDGNWKSRPEWHNVILVGKRAEGLSNLLKSGDRVMVEGRVKTRTVEGADGRTKYFTDIRARDLHLAGRPVRLHDTSDQDVQVQAVAAAG